MQILTDNIYITAYCTVGHVEDGIEIDRSICPENFFSEFDTNKFLYQNGEITENPDYVPPEPEPEPEPTPSLEEQISELKEQNQMLTDCILEMSEIIYGE